MRKSANKLHSQVQTIQRTVTRRNVTQVNGNKQIKEKQSLVLLLMPEDLMLFLTTAIKKASTCLQNYICAVQSQSTKCFALVACFTCCTLGDAN